MRSDRQVQSKQDEPTNKANIKEMNRIFFVLTCIAAAQYLVPAVYEMVTHQVLDDLINSWASTASDSGTCTRMPPVASA